MHFTFWCWFSLDKDSAKLSHSLKVSGRRRNTPTLGRNRSESLCAGLWVPCLIFCGWLGSVLGPNPGRSRRFQAGSLQPYEFIGFGAMEVTKPYECIGFGAMEVKHFRVLVSSAEKKLTSYGAGFRCILHRASTPTRWDGWPKSGPSRPKLNLQFVL